MKICFTAPALGLLLIGSAGKAAVVDFSKQIRPILSENCFFCHGPDEKKREAGLRLDEEVSAKKSNDGVIAVVPGDPEKSALLQRIISNDPDEVMPPPKLHKTVSPAQVELIRDWIRQGAKWGKHWSYEKVVRPPVPASGNAIDAFLTQRLQKEGLKPAPQADRGTLVRRIALDLTGLPPSLDELDRFSQGSIDAVIQHYMASPAYGEHWARQWLDLARYADSAGYPSDPGREIWAYRDWVIRALNQNLPFDQFTIYQLAGDLLPNPSEDQIIATAFHRNTMTQNEGGTSDEEFRNAAIIDRVNTTMAVWMGTTMACAQCHTHKYDPISIKEYFQFYAFLNQTADADKRDESPLYEFTSPQLKTQRDALQNELAALETKMKQPPPEWLTGLKKWDEGFPRQFAWQPLKPIQVTTESKTEARVQEDFKITLPKPVTKDEHTVTLTLGQKQLSAVRLETQPVKGFGNFVITSLKAEIVPPAGAPSPVARFVRVELPGKKKFLQLAEVEVFAGQKNIAPTGIAKQSSQYQDAIASRANDGRTDGEYDKRSVAHTSGTDDNPWWELDLKTAAGVDRIVVWNRKDGVGSRLDGFRVVLLDEARKQVWSSESVAKAADQNPFSLGGPSELKFAKATADFEQSGFSAASLVTPPEKGKAPSGWAVGGAADKVHHLTLMTSAPVAVPPRSKLRLRIEQKSPFANHTLGSYSVSVADHPRAAEVVSLPANVLAALEVPAAGRNAAQQKTVTDHYVQNVASEAAPARQKLAALKKQLADLKPNTVPVMKDLSAKERRKTFMQLRGNWQSLGDEVSEGTPAAFHALPGDAPKNRLTLAKWLVHRDNPLTARVAVNRLWETVFGVGIVRTSEEFGSQGDLPLHPELLDWLAAEFIDSGWDVKHMLTLMLSTSAYQRSSRMTDEQRERDPDNRLLASGPRFRSTGELLRDQALAISGLLSPKMFGPPVRPVSPNLGLNTAFGRSNDWTVSEGEDKHRRSVYTEVRRNSPYASFTTFDAGNREVCMLKRGRTNTPLQAFVTLNDPVFVETHQAMARRLLGEAKDTAARVNLLFKLCMSRLPTAKEAAELTKLYEASHVSYKADQAAATKLATEPLGPPPAGMDVTDLAAWTTVANVVMNLDEFLMRR